MHQYPGKKSWGESIFGKLGPSKAPCIPRNLQSFVHAQDRTWAKKRPEETLSFHRWLISKLSEQQLKTKTQLKMDWLSVEEVPQHRANLEELVSFALLSFPFLALPFPSLSSRSSFWLFTFNKISIKTLDAQKLKEQKFQRLHITKKRLCKNSVEKSLNKQTAAAYRRPKRKEMKNL